MKWTRHQDHGQLSQQEATRTTRICLQRTSCPSLAMLAATSKWLKLTGQDVNASKSLAFVAAHSARGPPTALEATLDGVHIPTLQEFRQLGVGVRTVP